MTPMKAASDYLAGAQRTLRHAEHLYAEERERLASSGRLIEIKSYEDGRVITRYDGDIGATFAPWMAPPARARLARGGR